MKTPKPIYAVHKTQDPPVLTQEQMNEKYLRFWWNPGIRRWYIWDSDQKLWVESTQ